MDQTRFSGITRLYGTNSSNNLLKSHVMVIGIGGVGSWTAECLARSGIGKITLVDIDDICIHNSNRQLHALTSTIGQPKIKVMADRLRDINPDLEVIEILDFYTKTTADTMLEPDQIDFVVDAIDSVASKCHLIEKCWEMGIPIVCLGGAAGKKSPELIQFAELSKTFNDPLLRTVRKKLRKSYREQRKKMPKLSCVFSTELPVATKDCSLKTSTQDSDEELLAGNQLKRSLDCDYGYGTASFVTGAFGIFAASFVVNSIANMTIKEK